MDINGCKPLFGHQVVASTNLTPPKAFLGTLEPIAGSTSTVKLLRVSDDVASKYEFAINGVDAIDVGIITFLQDIATPHD